MEPSSPRPRVRLPRYADDIAAEATHAVRARIVHTEESPEWLTLYLLLTCNAACPFCSTRAYTEEGVFAEADYLYGELRPLHEHTLSFEAICSLLDASRSRGVRRLNLQGGEPTMHDHLCEVVEYASRIGFEEIALISNGRRFADRAFAARVMALPLTSIGLSTYGHTAALHDASLGVSGAFDDLCKGVRNLVECARSMPRAPALNGLLVIHQQNYLHLTASFEHWYALGLRRFNIRLLRQVSNTRTSTQWFFDLAQLKEPLAHTLEAAVAKRDTQFVFSEIFYCLLADTHFAFVAADLAANRRLRHLSRVQYGGGESVVDDLAQRHVQANDPSGACQRCDLASACVRLESPYRELFTGALSPVHLREQVSRWVAGEIQPHEWPGLYHLLAWGDVCVDLDITAEDAVQLRARGLRAAHERRDATAWHWLFGNESQRRAFEQHIRALPRVRHAVRMVSRAQWDSTSATSSAWPTESEHWWTHVKAHADVASPSLVHALDSARRVWCGPLFGLFAAVETNAAGEHLHVLTFLFDPRYVTPADLRDALARSQRDAQ